MDHLIGRDNRDPDCIYNVAITIFLCLLRLIHLKSYQDPLLNLQYFTIFHQHKSDFKTTFKYSLPPYNMGSVTNPKIILYTNHACPWAHRAHIALRELGLEYEEHIIDLSIPRTQEYLAINPRGLVPTIKYNGNIVTESAIVAQFLVDSHPSHLEKATSEEGGALQRAKINFFVDTYFSKINSLFYAAMRASTEDKEKEAAVVVDAIAKEIEPQLQDAAPFFGGSSRLTLAEVSILGS